MDSFNLSAILLIVMLAISSSPLIFACVSCPSTPSPKTPTRPITPSPKTPKGPIIVPPIIGKPPITVPPITIPPIIGKPPITVPPVTVPPVIGKPPITVPPITVPPVIGKPPITVPPVIGNTPITVPPITVPPVIGKPPTTGTSRCPPPPAPAKTCPIDALKFGACLDLLGPTVQIGDPAVTCCPLFEGLAGLDAALCLCTTIKAKLLNINLYFPLALQLLVTTCGKSIPPGYTCS